MKVLIYSANYHPEPTGVGKYSGEMAAWLAKKGHEVRVVCAPPYYPNWRVTAPYSACRYAADEIDGVKIFRAPLWIPKKPTGVKRLLHLLSFAISSVPLVFRQVTWKPDLVFVVAPAFVCAPAGLLTASMSRAKSWIHIQDFEVDVAFRMGLLQGGRLRPAVLAIERFLLRRFDIASSISKKMVEKLIEKGVPRHSAALFPNWVDISKIEPLATPSPYRRELGIGEDKIVAMFSGTLASKQGLLVIPEAAKLMKNNSSIVFVICGDGVMKDDIISSCKGLPNVRILPLQPLTRLSDLLGLADIHLLPQSPEAEDLVLPSKLSGMLASGRPIIATCRPETEIGSIVSQCGYIVPPEDPVEMAAAISSLASDPRMRKQFGIRARHLALEHFAVDRILADFEARCMNAEPIEIVVRRS